ncbi:MAG: cysteine--tRNA ligase [Candidatus Woesearchaeota archaeon]
MLRFYNDLTKRKEEFVPIHPGQVGIYSCGPTVYNYAHIGNLRSFVFVDLLKRFLKYEGYSVKHVMNITDVDDKTIKGSQQEGVPLREFTLKYEKAFLEDLKALNIQIPDVMPRATEHIKEMTELIRKLYKNGYAYRAEDGSTYYSIAKFKDYGKLSGIKKEELKIGARVRSDEYAKEQAEDFALWKAWTPEDGSVFWETEYGRGRPGWHIECSAMSSKYLGETFDIHTGGIDLIFPHHENEIAQSEGANGKKFVNYWLHCEHLIVDGRKMSKSLGNVYTLRDITAMGYSPIALRYLLLSTHYKSQLNFTFDGLKAASEAVERLNNLLWNLKQVPINRAGSEYDSISELLKNAETSFRNALEDDLNISEALDDIFNLVRELNKRIGSISKNEAEEAIQLFKRIDSVLGVMTWNWEETLPEEIQKLIVEREDARRKRDYKKADEIRAEIEKRGIILIDTKDGVKWKRK